MTPFLRAVNEMGPVIADGRAMIVTAKRAARAGQWAEAAARLEAWAERIATAVEVVQAAEAPPDMDPEMVASVRRTLGSAARMYAMAIGAANDAWNRAAAESGMLH